MTVLDESVLWGLVGLLGLYVLTANAIELWSPAFWVFVFIIAVWVGKDGLFQHVPKWDSWIAWLVVGFVAIYTLNVNLALNGLINSGLAFLAVMFVLAMKADSLAH